MKIRCPNCKGKGFFKEEYRMVLRTEPCYPGSNLTKFIYSPDMLREFRDCEKCKGSGKINLIIRDRRTKK